MTPTLPSSTATTPRSSIELAKEAFKIETTTTAPSTTSSQAKASVWTLVKRHLKEHHDSVNAVYARLYGQGYERRVVTHTEQMTGAMSEQRQKKVQEVWEYERGVYGRS